MNERPYEETRESVDHPGVPVSVGKVPSVLACSRPRRTLSASLHSAALGGGGRGGRRWDPGQQRAAPHASPRAALRWGPGTVLLVVIHCG